MSKSDRKSAIAAAATKKGSRQERLDNATAPGVVRPSKPSSTKIPSALNLTKQQAPSVEDAVVQTEGTMREFVEAQGARMSTAYSVSDESVNRVMPEAKRHAPARAKAKAKDVDEAPVEADKELDATVVAASVEKKAKKPAKDPNFLSVSDIARELNIDPKRARARLRASGRAAAEGRWPLVTRGSEEHVALSTIIKGDDKSSSADAETESDKE